ncbi:MAG: ThuA domain-containing protein [Planctomycetes bacterium]|nr:ThuA domain-containing protein [Planctomycetota bacterium]
MKTHTVLSRLMLTSLLSAAVAVGVARAEKLPPAQRSIVPPSDAWAATVEKNAPESPTAALSTAAPRKVLVFSLFTGYDHKVIPHVDRALEILGRKTGAFGTTVTRDIEDLASDRLAAYDVLVLNNNCSRGARRHLLLDELERNARYAGMSETQRQAKADALEQSMLDFVRGGKGLVVIHGAPTLLNNSAEFTEMVGCAFDYHPPTQEVIVRPVDAEHPLVAAFRGKGPFIHTDEPYCFKGAYEKQDFRPLLAMDTGALKGYRGSADDVRYVSWIKPYGRGRVFYCSPSHYPESYESPTLLRFILDGVQYAAGDLKCEDTKR